MHWDPWQREVLEALGHAVYRAAPPPSAVPEASPSMPTGDALLGALLRAAARDVRDAEALLRAWPPTAQLRGDPAAKRALWPRLRALRASARDA